VNQALAAISKTTSFSILGQFGPTTGFFNWKLETQARFFRDLFAKLHVLPDLIVHARHIFFGPTLPILDEVEWRGRVVL
jgi:hypothetical protein